MKRILILLITSIAFSANTESNTGWSYLQTSTQAFYIFISPMNIVDEAGEHLIGYGDGSNSQTTNESDCGLNPQYCDVIGAFVSRELNENDCEAESGEFTNGICEINVGWSYYNSYNEANNGSISTTLQMVGASFVNGECTDYCNYLQPGEIPYLKFYDASEDLIFNMESDNELGEFHNNIITVYYPDCNGISECVQFTLNYDTYIDIDGEYFYESDILFIQELVNLNNIDFEGTILNLGVQEWIDGRLIEFQTTTHNIMTLPESVGELSELQQLRLQNNNLTSIPSSIGNLSNLNTLKIYLNPNLESIPDEIVQLENLDTLKIHFNSLRSLPESLCDLDIDWSNSETFQIENNFLCPPYLNCLEDYVGYQNTSECEELSICNEETEVELWGWCFNIEQTTELDLSNNQLTGEIPPEIGSLENLTNLDLSVNQLIGEIPSEIGNLINLQSLHLGANMFTSIPSEIGNLTNLITLNIVANYLNELTPEIGNLENLTELDLTYNQLTGEIPPEIGNLQNLTELYLSYNQLTGEIPPEIGNLENLTYLILNDNQLTGEIPAELGALENLTFLYLSYNQLLGTIPYSIGNLYNLQSLNLSNNLLQYIDHEICNIDLNSIQSSFRYNKICKEYHFECISEFSWGVQDESNCDCLGVTYGDAILDECNVCDGDGIEEGYCDCAGNLVNSEACSCESGLIDDLFISEYHDGSSPNQYIEIYNGTDSAIDLNGYELWILKSENDMTWEPIYNYDEQDWESDFWVLLFNSDSSMTYINDNLQLDDQYMQRVNTPPIPSGQTLMIIRDGEGEDFNFIGRNFVVWDRLVKISGDEPVALLKNGQIIDKVGDDENVSSGGWDVGEGTTRDHTLIRKSNVYSGNTDWVSSALLEWDVYDRDTFEDVFNHNCNTICSSPGDLNNDLALNIYDIIIMVGCVLSESCDFCSDINQDGSADILDIVFLVNIILEQ